MRSLLYTVIILNILLHYRTAVVGTVTASSEQQNTKFFKFVRFASSTIASDPDKAVTPAQSQTPKGHAMQPSPTAAASSSCARCEGPWQTQFVYLLRANLWHELTDERRAWPLEPFTELTSGALAARIREMLSANELAGDRHLLKFWANFEVVEREETRLFHDHFEKNLSSPTTIRVFRVMRRILYNRTLSEYEKCAIITTVLRANDESCRELRQQQPYKTQVMTQRPFGPIAPSFILASVEEAERARAVDIWLNASTRFHAPLREMTADFAAWLRRQSSPSVSATFEALLLGSGVWLRQRIADANFFSISKNIFDILDRTLPIFLGDGDDTGVQVCLKLIDLLAQIDERDYENELIAALRQSTARCGACSNSVLDASDDDGGSDFLRAHFLHGILRFSAASSFEALLTLDHV